MAELSGNGLLKVHLRRTAHAGQVPLKGISFFPAHAWQRINLDLYTLLIHSSTSATDVLVGLNPRGIEQEIFTRLIDDGVPEKNARHRARQIASGEEDNRPAGKSMYVFQRVG